MTQALKYFFIISFSIFAGFCMGYPSGHADGWVAGSEHDYAAAKSEARHYYYEQSRIDRKTCEIIREGK